MTRDVPFPPRDESLAFLDTLNDIYRDDLHRQPVDDYYVDKEGTAVWMEGYLRHRVNGATYTEAVSRVRQSIYEITTPRPDVPTGRTRGDFLYPYFGPAYMSYQTLAKRETRFDVQRATGATDILIMPWIHRPRFEEHGWAGSQGFDFRSDMPEFVRTLEAIRDRGMRASVIAWDRGSGAGIGGIVGSIVDAVRQLHEAAAGLVDTISPAFEIDEGGFGDFAQVDLFERLHTVAPGVRLAAHYNRVPEDAGHWRRMRDAGCTDLWVQHGRDDSLTTLATDTRRWIRMLPSEVAYTCAEHTAPAGNSAQTEAERDARWAACAAVMRDLDRPLHSFNSTSAV